MSTSVEIIVSTLSELEAEIDLLASKVELMRKQIFSNSEEQVAFLREKLIGLAKVEAETIISNAKEEAEKESAKIMRENEEQLDKIRKNIDSSLPKGVEHVIKALFNSNI
jgi:F0F1-type ATP synthase membrane subunit b/b'